MKNFVSIKGTLCRRLVVILGLPIVITVVLPVLGVITAAQLLTRWVQVPFMSTEQFNKFWEEHTNDVEDYAFEEMTANRLYVMLTAFVIVAKLEGVRVTKTRDDDSSLIVQIRTSKRGDLAVQGYYFDGSGRNQHTWYQFCDNSLHSVAKGVIALPLDPSWVERQVNRFLRLDDAQQRDLRQILLKWEQL